MENLDLLAREDEFKKLNRQLEKKTESLIKEIEHAMHKQDIFTDFTTNIYYNSNAKKHHCETQNANQPPTFQQNLQESCKTMKKNLIKTKRLNMTQNKQVPQEYENEIEHIDNSDSKSIDSGAQPVKNMVSCDCCTHKTNNDDMEFLFAFVSVNVKDQVLPQSFLKERVTVENVCKFLSSKVKLMQVQIDKLQHTVEKKASQCEMHLTQLAELESQKLGLLNTTNNMKATTVETRAKCLALQNKLEEKDKLYKEKRSEADKLSSEVKRLKSKAAGLEARCASQEETLDTMKQQLEAAKKAEKEFRDSTRSLSASHQTIISRLEDQIKVLQTHVDRQAALINNLRKQNAILSTDGALKALEREYSKLLDQDF